MMLSFLPAFEYDQNAFRFWSIRLAELGPAQFYSKQAFTNNPVGFLYILWIIGSIKTYLLSHSVFFQSNQHFDLLLKLPANIADLASAVLIYLIIKRKFSERSALFGFTLYAFNPAIISESAVFGQYNGIAVFFLLLSTYSILIKKAPGISSCFAAIAFTFKPQAIVFIPLLGLLIILRTKPLEWLRSFFIFLVTLFLIYFPFFPTNPFFGLLYVNQNSAGLFNCTSCFAFNFWGIFGNWQNDLQTFITIPYVYWRIIFLFTILTLILFSKPFRLKFKSPYFYLTTAITIMASFMLLTRVHERYLFLFFPFLLLAATMLRSKILIIFYFFMSGLYLLNIYIPYAYYNNRLQITNLPVNYLINNFKIFSLISFLSFVLFLIFYFSYVKQNQNT
ncbi:MAG: glycosyltransferase family 39 protein [Candidatus Daviesbacteria bacterium]|nr:glycosyltransferase family 39 protein [Candidatus Daviesbacteria bacterium]